MTYPAGATRAFQYGLGIFALTALLGLTNATKIFGDVDRNTLLTHLHSGDTRMDHDGRLRDRDRALRRQRHDNRAERSPDRSGDGRVRTGVLVSKLLQA